ncbi:MAG TPA: hypothetical protein VFW40_07980 [Capsulimonadaceae bacterium]|nr:hypothetical protein [Capsulimonadaceae bacterium]
MVPNGQFTTIDTIGTGSGERPVLNDVVAFLGSQFVHCMVMREYERRAYYTARWILSAE